MARFAIISKLFLGHPLQRERVSKKICSYIYITKPVQGHAGLNSHLNFRSQIVELAAFRAVRRALKPNLS